MKAFKIITLVCIAILFSGMANAQKVKLVYGKLDFLKGQKVIKVEYDYEKMTVGKMSETKYIAKKVKGYNEDEAGKGDKWEKAWFNDREDRFQPKFEELINKYLDKAGVTVSPTSEDAKYVLILKTTFTEPGYNIGISRKSAYINATAIFVEKDNHEKILAKIEIAKSPGATAFGYDFDTGQRISEAYAKCGKSLGGFLTKKAFK